MDMFYLCRLVGTNVVDLEKPLASPHREQGLRAVATHPAQGRGGFVIRNFGNNAIFTRRSFAHSFNVPDNPTMLTAKLIKSSSEQRIGGMPCNSSARPTSVFGLCIYCDVNGTWTEYSRLINVLVLQEIFHCSYLGRAFSIIACH